MSIPAASHTRSPVELVTKSAKALTKAVTSLPKTINSTANDMVKAALDPDLTRYAQLGKTFRNGPAAVKNQLQQLKPTPKHDVILIGSPGKTGKAFELSAKTLQKRYPQAEVIYAYGDGLRGPEAHKVVMDKLKAAPIRNFVYTGHASESGLWVAPNTALGVKHLKDVNIENAVIYGCNAGDKGGFGQQLAEQNGASVRAIEGTMQFSGTETGWANYDFTNLDGSTMDINKTPLKSNYPGEVWGVPAHPWVGDEWKEYGPALTPQPSPGPSPRP